MAKNQHTISLIIPAHNEAANIKKVLLAIAQVDELDEIIVVADACQDQTAQIAASVNPQIKIIERPTTQGKGSAMIAGVKATKGDILVFVDADLENLRPEHIKQIINPVINDEAIMSVGLRDRVLGLSALIPKILPMYAIGGERAMTRKFFESLPKDENILDFGIETVMNYHAQEQNLKVAMPVLKNLHQIIKEKKWGLLDGLANRLKLTHQVLRTRKIMKHRHLTKKYGATKH